MMQRLVGLEDGICYKIRNRADNTVIELKEDINKMICGEESFTEEPRQIFEVIEETSDEFRIACRYQSSDTKLFWDFKPHNNRIIQKKKSTASTSTQIWGSDRVPNMDTSFFFIISLGSTRYLKSQGKNRQVGLAEKNESDHSQHWQLEEVP